MFVHADGRFALCVLQFTQFRTPILHRFFTNYSFAVSRFAFRRLLIAFGCDPINLPQEGRVPAMGKMRNCGMRNAESKMWNQICGTTRVGLKIEIHEIHQNLRGTSLQRGRQLF